MTAIKKRRITALSIAAMMMVSTMLPISASAATEPVSPYYYEDYKDSLHRTVKAGNYSYDCYSTLYYGRDSTKASVWAVEQNRKDAPAALIAYLYVNGSIELDSGVIDSSSYIHFAETPITRFYGELKAGGRFIFEYNDGTGDTAQGNFPEAKVNYNPVRAIEEEKHIVTSYPVNQVGQTYGSYLDCQTAGGPPDLISAIGVNGTYGYVSRDDFSPEFSSVKEAKMWQDEVDKNNLIPLYDQEGNVIGQYALGTRNNQEELDPQIAQRIEALGGDSNAISAQYFASTAVEELYPVNAKGESYGSYADFSEKGYAPQLISIIGDNGKHGYAYRQQFRTRKPGESIDVYDLNGKIIDSYSSIGLKEEQP